MQKSSNKFGPERPIHLSLERPLKSPFALRSQLKNAKRVVIKVSHLDYPIGIDMF